LSSSGSSAFALGHPGYGPRRIASELGRERWGGIQVSHNGVWRCLHPSDIRLDDPHDR
jgi:hypothetical protein